MTISLRSAGLVLLLLLAIVHLVACVQQKRSARVHLELDNVQCKQQSDGSITCKCDDPTQTAIDARDPARSGKFRCSDGK